MAQLRSFSKTCSRQAADPYGTELTAPEKNTDQTGRYAMPGVRTDDRYAMLNSIKNKFDEIQFDMSASEPRTAQTRAGAEPGSSARRRRVRALGCVRDELKDKRLDGQMPVQLMTIRNEAQRNARPCQGRSEVRRCDSAPSTAKIEPRLCTCSIPEKGAPLGTTAHPHGVTQAPPTRDCEPTQEERDVRIYPLPDRGHAKHSLRACRPAEAVWVGPVGAVKLQPLTASQKLAASSAVFKFTNM